ncbi:MULTISPECIES: iron-containing redox enzyme family protein [Bradyrhizobium]|jgi:hypothetical protein|uniref:iron-containing redox enzyme family protein n=1 Tax=Bradyrhizobium TaxID=374 RepID=UPI0003A40C69|nr:iron-containing redox enzyme family protein [Bradyrhizobium denitrificans]MCL8484288.1 iron-containing redox enzyme family protein [Bradyrhizobium denitrificans]RTM00936.1 MAG: iron-containing redox enzyme family protein [Bradyrhizobiaceae bacterium]
MNQLSLATPAAARADQRVQDQNQVLALIDLIERGGGFPATPATGTIYSRLADRAHRLDTIDAVCRRGFREDDAEALRAAHRLLAQIYAERLRLPSGDERRPSAEADDIAELIETYLLGFEERAIDHGLVASAPRSGAALARWLRELVEQHPATAHPFYTDFMRRATKRDLEYYSIQETTLDPRFDDAMALLQLGTPDVAKMEIAKNYWDEMGNGEIPRIHTKLFQRVLDVLGITASAVRAQLRTESIACGNLSMTMVLQRCHFHKAIGYYGVTEYVVPFRFGHVVEAWERLGLDPSGLDYYHVHYQIDAEHGNAWFDHVIAPIVDAQPDTAALIARGALYRLNSSQRYLDRLLSDVSGGAGHA